MIEFQKHVIAKMIEFRKHMIAKVVKMCICVIMKVIEMYICVSVKVVEIYKRPRVRLPELSIAPAKLFSHGAVSPFWTKKDRRGRSEYASRFEQSQGRESPESEMDVETPQEYV